MEVYGIKKKNNEGIAGVWSFDQRPKEGEEENPQISRERAYHTEAPRPRGGKVLAGFEKEQREMWLEQSV